MSSRCSPGKGVDGVEDHDGAWAVVVGPSEDGGLQLVGADHVDRLAYHGRLVGRRFLIPIERDVRQAVRSRVLMKL